MVRSFARLFKPEEPKEQDKHGPRCDCGRPLKSYSTVCEDCYVTNLFKFGVKGPMGHRKDRN